jgi:hypothetical protein
MSIKIGVIGYAKKCSCGSLIEEARLKATHGKAMTCISCMKSSDVSRVAGFPIISGKNTYTELQVVSQEEANRLFALQERKGQSPGKGVRMSGH